MVLTLRLPHLRSAAGNLPRFALVSMGRIKKAANDNKIVSSAARRS